MGPIATTEQSESFPFTKRKKPKRKIQLSKLASRRESTCKMTSTSSSCLFVIVIVFAAFALTTGKAAVKNEDLAEQLKEARHESAELRQRSEELHQKSEELHKELEKSKEEMKNVVLEENKKLRSEDSKLKREADKLKAEAAKYEKRTRNCADKMKNFASAMLSWNGNSTSCITTTRKSKRLCDNATKITRWSRKMSSEIPSGRWTLLQNSKGQSTTKLKNI